MKKPLTNLSPYLKSTRNITDEEETKIIELIQIIQKRVQRWDDYEQEKFRRYLELQDPEFRRKLLECMKEHIQEINLVDSFFIRYKVKDRPRTAQPMILKPTPEIMKKAKLVTQNKLDSTKDLNMDKVPSVQDETKIEDANEPEEKAKEQKQVEFEQDLEKEIPEPENSIQNSVQTSAHASVQASAHASVQASVHASEASEANEKSKNIKKEVKIVVDEAA